MSCKWINNICKVALVEEVNWVENSPLGSRRLVMAIYRRNFASIAINLALQLCKPISSVYRSF